MARALVGCVVALAWALPSMAAEKAPESYKIVVNAANTQSVVTREQLAKIFLRKATKWDSGVPAVPIDLAEGSPVRDAFSKAVHGKPTAALKAYWQQQIFSGRDLPPSERKSEAEVLAFVRANAGAVGYVSAELDIRDAKVLKVKD